MNRDQRDRLITDNQGLVWHHAKRWKRRYPWVAWDDIIGDGMLGLIEAANRYDGRTEFHRYAAHWIDAKIRYAIYYHWYQVRIPRHLHARIGMYLDAKRQLESRLGRVAMFSEVADELGLGRTRRRTLWAALHARRINMYPQG